MAPAGWQQQQRQLMAETVKHETSRPPPDGLPAPAAASAAARLPMTVSPPPAGCIATGTANRTATPASRPGGARPAATASPSSSGALSGTASDPLVVETSKDSMSSMRSQRHTAEEALLPVGAV